MKKITLNDDEVLILHTVNEDGKSYGGFCYPKSGIVEAPDWNGKPECGGGLHGLLRGCGDGSLLESGDAQLIKVKKADVLEFGGKCKYPSGEVVFYGARDKAIEILDEIYPGAPIVFVKRIGGDKSTLTGGYKSTLTGGYKSTLTGGYKSTLTGGEGSTLTGGDWSTLTGGDWSTLTGGYKSTLTGGDWSTLTGGYKSTLTGGDKSTLTGGYKSTLTGGDESTLTGGEGSTLVWKIWDGDYFRIHTHYVGENGIKANVPYRLNGNNEIEEAK